MAAWLSVGLWGLVGLSCWQVLAAAFDARHFHPQIALASVTSDTNIDLSPLNDGNPTWIVASAIANHVAYLLIVTVALAAWLSRGYALHKTLLRVPVSVLAMCSAGLGVIGVGGLVDHHMDAAVAVLGATPDTLRATAGQNLAVGLGVAVAAVLLARAMGRLLAAERGSSAFSSPGTSHI